MHDPITAGRRGFLRASALGTLAAWLPAAATATAGPTAPRTAVFPPAPLAPQPLQLLPTGAIRPSG